METVYTKLRDLVDETFRVEEGYGFTYKKWDAESGRMLMSEKFEKGYKKTYSILTNRGKLDLGSGQLGNLLEAVYSKGTADLIGQTFSVKSNGKQGMDIRYFFNVVRAPKEVVESRESFSDGSPAPDEVHEVDDEEPINLGDIPF